jgi:hypothetical protein
VGNVDDGYGDEDYDGADVDEYANNGDANKVMLMEKTKVMMIILIAIIAMMIM